jgi:hypothetical protein
MVALGINSCFLVVSGNGAAGAGQGTDLAGAVHEWPHAVQPSRTAAAQHQLLHPGASVNFDTPFTLHGPAWPCISPAWPSMAQRVGSGSSFLTIPDNATWLLHDYPLTVLSKLHDYPHARGTDGVTACCKTTLSISIVARALECFCSYQISSPTSSSIDVAATPVSALHSAVPQ